MSKRFDTALSALCDAISTPLYRLPPEVKEQVCEIRLRVNRPVCLCTREGIHFVGRDGSVSRRLSAQALTTNRQDLQESFRVLCGYSVYAHQEEIQNGFVTYLCGHRVGICGTAVVEHGTIRSIRDITSMNVRVAKESYGIADRLLKRLGSKVEQGLLIAGKPGCGKTTMLRDLCRQLASGTLGAPWKVALVDERSEVAGVWNGEPQNDIGLCCDVLDGYPKSEGILHAIRCLSPQVILCDELGSFRDTAAVLEGVRAGAAMITTIHAGSLEDVLCRPQGRALLETGAFRYLAMLDSVSEFGRVQEVYDVNGLDT